MNIGIASLSPTVIRAACRNTAGTLLLATTCLTAQAGAAASCPGTLQRLSHYAGSYDTLQLMAEPEVKQRLDAVLGLQAPHLQANLGVTGAVVLDACHLVVSGSAPHKGGEEEAIVDVSLADGRVVAALLSKRQIALFTDNPAASSQPRSILVWIREHRNAIVHSPQGLRIVLQRPENARLAQAQAARFSGAVETTVSLGELPTPQQRAAIERVARAEMRETRSIEGRELSFNVGSTDLNDDGRPDLLVQFSSMGYCGSAGCSGFGLLAAPQGYGSKRFALPNFGGTVHVLKTVHNGMHDLRFDDSRTTFTWKHDAYN